MLENATQAQALAAAGLLVNAPERVRGILQRLVDQGAAPVAVIGDSHSTLLVRRGRLADGRFLLPIHRFCSGGSARGLGNTASRSGYGEQVIGFVEAVQALPVDVPLIFHFGQVDVEFVHAFQRLDHGPAPFDSTVFEVFCRETVGRYLDFLTGIIPTSRRMTAVISGVFPPALSDAEWRAGYVNAHLADLHGPMDAGPLDARIRALDVPSQRERTAQHARFNILLAEAAAAHGFRFIDDRGALVDASGCVASRWLGPAAGGDHHLDYFAARDPMLRRLGRALGGPERD